ncbi:MAG TPA: ThiF family adenylyltransferase [Verrucomicrobiae bacterium]|nr:ThiF family adenylyltransferase [Verrucomicrobiae bacterium]
MDQQAVTPQFYRVDDPALAALKEEHAPLVIEAMPEALDDLFKIRFPHLMPGSSEAKATRAAWDTDAWGAPQVEEKSQWAYFPWKNTLVHLPDEETFHELRTARNKFLITEEEQRAFYGAKIGIAGMSVGSSVLNALVLSGGGKHLRLADHDTLSITNLNRLFGSVCDLTVPKLTAAMRRVYEINPYAELVPFWDGVTEEKLDAFFVEGGKLDLFIEEVDDILLKVLTRRKARELGVPVIMATDNGDNTIIDVERFDLEPDRPLFHGRADEELLSRASATMPNSEKVKLASAIVGSDITPRTQYSLMQVGQTLPSWPQLGNAAILSGAATSYTARRILTGEEMPSGRYTVHFDRDIDPSFNSSKATAERQRLTDEFDLGFDLIFNRLEDPL